MDALDLFRQSHARTHAAAMSAATELVFFEDRLLHGLSDAQIRACPGNGGNSLAWLLWHMARVEDVAVNVLLADRPQVLNREGWLPRLNLTQRDVGTGMGDDEVAGLSERVDLTALRAYRLVVGRATRAVVAGLRPEELENAIDASRVRRAADEGVFGTNAGWLATFWEGQTKAFLLTMPAMAHNYLHLGEAFAVKSWVIGGPARS